MACLSEEPDEIWRLPLHPAVQGFRPRITQEPCALSDPLSQGPVLVFNEPLVDFIMARKHKSSDAGNLDTPERSCKVFLLNETVKVLNLIRKGRKSHAEVAMT